MRILLLLLAVLLVGCGAPTVGASCTAPQDPICTGGSLYLCEASAWAAYPCAHCDGSACTWVDAQTGDACPESASGKGWCPFDGRQLTCFYSSTAGAGVFVESACAACTAGKSLKDVGSCN